MATDGFVFPGRSAVGGPGVLRAARREARAVAAAIDLIVVALTVIPFVLASGLALLLQTDWLAVDPSGSEWAVGYVIGIAWFLVPPLYFGVAATHGGTLGARLLGLQVRRGDGEPASPTRAHLRGAMLYPSLILAGVGVWLPLFDREGRGLADRVSGTRLFEVNAVGATA